MVTLFFIDIIKYFAYELGTPGIYDAKSQSGMLRGKYDDSQLALVLDQFIDQFILCQACQNPETLLYLNKKALKLQCKACGASSMVDKNHRLTRFIIKHLSSIPPRRKSIKTNPSQHVPANHLNSSMIHGDILVDHHDDDDTWGEDDFSPSAIHQRRNALLGESQSSSSASSPSQSSQSCSITDTDMMEQLRFRLLQPQALTIIHQEVMAWFTTHAWDAGQLATMVFQALFDHTSTLMIPTHLPILSLFVTTEQQQHHVLQCIEQFCCQSELWRNKINVILNQCYERDVLEEDVILQWHNSSPAHVDPLVAQDLRQRAQKFITWLKTAALEESD